MVPGGDPPTLISAPSRRPKRSLAAAIIQAWRIIELNFFIESLTLSIDAIMFP
jgi:hypothetical protein